MGRHEENTTQPGIVNRGGTNTFKNTVVNGKKVDAESGSSGELAAGRALVAEPKIVGQM